MVEFALTVPVLLFLFLGVIELGHGLNSYLTVLQSTRDAARLGSQTGIADSTAVNQLKTLITNETSRLSSAPIPMTTANCGTSGEGYCISTNCPGGTTTTTVPQTCNSTLEDKWLTVRVCYDHPLMVGIPWLTGNSLRICSATKMRIAA
jgi:Flp pilus assembly protein TadG